MKHTFHDHWDTIMAGATVASAMIVWLWKTLTKNFATKDELRECVDLFRTEMKEYRNINSQQHQEILGHIIEKNKHNG